MGKIRYGFSDFISDDENVGKYAKVFDLDGNEIGEVECYYIEDEDEE